ncbi:hypothetical protein H632_c67p0 [Helicosporidium sp. ATCC 50920]|nr:hypothetical protein H632_c67p0 [Helicosporidium sp. ATCC 50920]|eukprot:KDD76917.1 hypothetical protein H632_c67p0 [Helicosporidium sp. ATCC 50920]
MTAPRVPGADVEVILPVLPLHDFVLLPAGFTRVVIKGCSPLVDHLLSRKGEEALVAAIPCLSESPPSGDEDAGGFNLDALHDVGTVARVVQLVRRPEVRYSLVRVREVGGFRGAGD